MVVHKKAVNALRHMEDNCGQKEKTVVVATKVKREDRIKLELIAKAWGMNLYQLIQGLLLFLLRSFDRQSDISADHETLIKSYLHLIASQKDSFSLIQSIDASRYKTNKAVFFIERGKGERPQMISIGVNENGKMTESYNTNEILSDVLASIDYKVLDELNDEKQALGQIGIIDTIRSIVKDTHQDRMHEEINNMFVEEIDEMFSDLAIETFEELADTHYKRKHTKGIDGVNSYSVEAAKSTRDKRLLY